MYSTFLYLNVCLYLYWKLGNNLDSGNGTMRVKPGNIRNLRGLYNGWLEGSRVGGATLNKFQEEIECEELSADFVRRLSWQQPEKCSPRLQELFGKYLIVLFYILIFISSKTQYNKENFKDWKLNLFFLKITVPSPTHKTPSDYIEGILFGINDGTNVTSRGVNAIDNDNESPPPLPLRQPRVARPPVWFD